MILQIFGHTMVLQKMKEHWWKLRYGAWSLWRGIVESRRIMTTSIYGVKNRETYETGRRMGKVTCLLNKIQFN